MSDLTLSFGADVNELKRGIAQVNTMMSAGLNKGLEQASRRGAISGRELKQSFREVGQAISIVSALIGGQTAQWVGFAAVAATSVGSVAKVLTSLVGGPITLVIGILGVLAAAVIGAASNWEAFQTTVIKVWNTVVGAVTGAIAKIAAGLRSLPIISDLFGESLEGVEDAARRASVVAEDTVRRIKEMELAQAALKKTTEDITKLYGTFEDRLARIKAKVQLYGETSQTVREKIDATKDAHVEFIARLNQAETAYARTGSAADKAAVQALRAAQAQDGQWNTDTLNAYIAGLERLFERQKSLEDQAAAQAKGEAGGVLLKGALADRMVPEDTASIVAGRLANVRQEFDVWKAELQLTMEDLQTVGRETFDSFAQGLGDAVAQLVVHGQSAKQVLDDLWRSIVGQVISSLVTLGIQQVAYAIIGVGSAAKTASAQIGAFAATTYAAVITAFAVAAASLGLAGLPLLTAAPAAAAGLSTTLLLGAAAAGTAGQGVGAASAVPAAQGLAVTGPTLAYIGEGRNPHEYVLPQSRLDALTEGGGGKTQTIIWNVDGRTLARIVARGLPEVLEIQGIRA